MSNCHTVEVVERDGELWLLLPQHCVTALGLTPPAPVCWVVRDGNVMIVPAGNALAHEIVASGEIVDLQGET
jgi:prophage antirepressor-like protein